MTIPRFSPRDPEVFVFVKADDFQGVQPVERQASGQWHASKFLYNVPKYNLGPLIEKIRKLEFVELAHP